MKKWYLIHCKPRQESLALENLERQGYAGYLPLTTVRKRIKGRVVSGIGPMFPRYLFIRLSDTSDDWRPIRSTIGVANLVRFGQAAAQVPDQLIASLRNSEDEKGLCPVEQKSYKEGDHVRIAQGVFEGYEAILTARSSKERVELLISNLEKSMKIYINQSDIDILD